MLRRIPPWFCICRVKCCQYGFFVTCLILTAVCCPSAFADGTSCTTNEQGLLLDEYKIRQLMARYTFAMDWRNAEDFASTFVENGVVVYPRGTYEGHEALKKIIEEAAKREAALNEGMTGHLPAQRTLLHNLVTDITCNKAKAWGYWTVVDNRTEDYSPRITLMGHYEDELIKLDGKWYFVKRKIFSEDSPNMHADQISPLKQQ